MSNEGIYRGHLELLANDPRHEQAVSWALDEIDRLRALNAKLVTALEALFKVTIDGYLDRPEQVSALNQARAALAEAREFQSADAQ